MENTLQEARIPEIWETEEDKEISVADLKKKYIAFAHSRFVHIPPIAVVNKITDWRIELSNRVISEWRIKSRTRERILAIQLLAAMIEGAKFLKTEKDNKNTPGIENVSYFENQCKINGKPFRINITVKKQKSLDRRFAYYYSATELEIK